MRAAPLSALMILWASHSALANDAPAASSCATDPVSARTASMLADQFINEKLQPLSIKALAATGKADQPSEKVALSTWMIRVRQAIIDYECVDLDTDSVVAQMKSRKTDDLMIRDFLKSAPSNGAPMSRLTRETAIGEAYTAARNANDFRHGARHSNWEANLKTLVPQLRSEIYRAGIGSLSESESAVVKNSSLRKNRFSYEGALQDRMGYLYAVECPVSASTFPIYTQDHYIYNASMNAVDTSREFPTEGYSGNGVLLRSAYDASYHRDWGPDAIYIQEFLRNFASSRDCSYLVNDLAYAKITAIASARLGLNMLLPTSRPSLTGSPVISGFNRGIKDAIAVLGPANISTINGENDAKLFAKRHTCDSDVARRFFGNLNNWIISAEYALR